MDTDELIDREIEELLAQCPPPDGIDVNDLVSDDDGWDLNDD